MHYVTLIWGITVNVLLGGIWKEVVVACVNVQCYNMTGVSEQNHDELRLVDIRT
jgi:hypothetical protein